jgi:hypothetical protein
MNTKGKKKIVLWGGTQVGKTALLASALFYPDPRMTQLCRDTADGSRYEHLSDTWNRLRTNRVLIPTAALETGISLQLANGEEIELSDVRGGITSRMNELGVRQILESSDAVLFLAEYDSQGRSGQMGAIEIARALVRDKPTALALTKCERFLKYEDPRWDHEPGWLKDTPLWSTFQHQLEYFHETAWPTSVFGYAEPEKWPAVILGEMGQILPFRIQPRNAAKPLLYLLRKLASL